MNPPKFLAIAREHIKPGKAVLYNEIETEGARICGRMKCPNSYLAVSSVTGHDQAWWLTPFDSYIDLERIASGYAANASLQAELARIVERKADIIVAPELLYAAYREDLSTNSGPDLPHCKFLSITEISVALGHEEDFAQLRKVGRSAAHHAHGGESHWAYQVFSGAADNRFLILTPLRGLKDIEQVRDLASKIQGGSADTDFHRLTAAAVTASETFLFTPMPAWSHLPKEWIDVDPEFWGAAAAKEK